MKITYKSYYTTPILFITVFLFGIFGFMLVSKDTFVDALYMTIITISTVGYGTLHELNESEKIFTTFLIVFSFFTYAYSIKTVSEYFVDGSLIKKIRIKKMQQKIQQLSKHTIVCGYGRNGKQAVKKLLNYEMPTLIIEKDDELISELKEKKTLCIDGDATSDEILIKANLAAASYLITALPSDADNLFVVLSARQLNKKITIISRASDEASYTKLKIAGANYVIMPDKVGGEHMASLVVTPDTIEFVEQLTITKEGLSNIKEIPVNELPTKFLNKSIIDLDIRNKTGCTIIGFKNSDNQYIVNPTVDTKLIPDTTVIVLGSIDQIQQLNKIL